MIELVKPKVQDEILSKDAADSDDEIEEGAEGGGADGTSHHCLDFREILLTVIRCMEKGS